MHIHWSDPNYWYLIAAAVVVVVGVGRLARVITVDSFPPAAYLRVWWSGITRYGDWSLLARCFWCLSPWLMLVAMGWFYLGTMIVWVGVVWWVFWGWLALSYCTAMLVARDDPHD